MRSYPFIVNRIIKGYACCSFDGNDAFYVGFFGKPNLPKEFILVASHFAHFWSQPGNNRTSGFVVVSIPFVSNMSGPVLVTGASGMLGRAVMAELSARKIDAVGTSFSRERPGFKKVDLTDAAAVSALMTDVKPKAVIHCAAERRPDVVEKDPGATERLNVTVPLSLAKSLEPGAVMIHLSSDYVFDGTSPPYGVNDAMNPLNKYGVSKVEAEKALRGAEKAGQIVIIRVPLLYSRGVEWPDESVLTGIAKGVAVSAAAGKGYDADDLHTRYPTDVADLAKVLVTLVTDDAVKGKVAGQTVHWSGLEKTTKYHIAVACAKELGLPTGEDAIVPGRTAPAPGTASRPLNSALDSGPLRELLGWKEIETQLFHTGVAEAVASCRSAIDAAAAEAKK